MQYNPPTTIDLLRHGECQGGDIYRGHTDVELTETGWQQMHSTLAHYNNAPPWDQIISSPLQRCHAFANKLGSQTQTKVTTLRELKEMNFGQWEGQQRKDIWQTQRVQVSNFMEDPVKHPPPKGENLNDFQQRVLKGFLSLLNSYQGKHLLLVQHGGTQRIILAHLLQMPLDKILRLDVPYAALSRIKIYHEGDAIYPLIIFHNRFHDLNSNQPSNFKPE